jgi:hypothetical protein
MREREKEIENIHIYTPFTAYGFGFYDLGFGFEQNLYVWWLYRKFSL